MFQLQLRVSLNNQKSFMERKEDRGKLRTAVLRYTGSQWPRVVTAYLRGGYFSH